MIICKNIKKDFGPKNNLTHALRGINLKVEDKEFIIIMGPSGSGKTTFLSIIAGILNQDEGECIILGQNIGSLPEKEKTSFRGKNIGFVFQSFNLIPTLTAQENASIPLLLNGSHDIARDRAKKILTRLGLKDKLNSYPAELSGGEQQRVAIARGCVHRPKIILCDEPTSFLDSENGIKVVKLLKEIQKETLSTLVVVSHDPRITAFADRIVKIENGTISKT